MTGFMNKSVILIFLIAMILIPLCAKTVTRPYSYLSQPPISASINVTPDKEKYNRNEIINFKVIIALDTLKAEKGRQYKIVIGNLSEILVSSQLMKSDVWNSYEMNFEKNVVKLNFTVQMLEDTTPPFIKVECMRLANDKSVTKKQFRNLLIDQYETVFVTSPKFRATKNN